MKFDSTDIIALTVIVGIILWLFGMLFMLAYDTHERHETVREILKTMSTLIENGQEIEAKKLAEQLEKMK